MEIGQWIYIAVFLGGVFLASLSQVLLKKAAIKHYDTVLKEYLNPLVIIGYSIFLLTTFITVFAYKGIPLSLGPVLETTGYIYVTLFGVFIFKEQVDKRKIIALLMIVAGIIIYAI